MQSSGHRLLRISLAAAVVAAASAGTLQARAQDTPKPPASGSGTQPATKSISDIAPKTLAVDPCKAKNPPSYCGKH